MKLPSSISIVQFTESQELRFQKCRQHRGLGLLICVYKQNIVNGVWIEPSATFGHRESSGAERSLTRSAGGRYSKHLSGKRRQLWKCLRILLPVQQDVTIGRVGSGLKVRSNLIYVGWHADVIVLEVADVKALLLSSGRSFVLDVVAARLRTSFTRLTLESFINSVANFSLYFLDRQTIWHFNFSTSLR